MRTIKTIKTMITTVAVFGALAFGATRAEAGAEAFDKAMKPILAKYAAMHRALCRDSVKGVAKAAKKLAKLTKALKPKAVTGTHAGHYAKLPANLKTAALKISKAKGIKNIREAFKGLSRPMAMWATMSKPAGINVVFCSMAKSSWLQTGKKIKNPYYSIKMRSCGQIIGGAHKGDMGGHMGTMKGGKKGMHHGKH